MINVKRVFVGVRESWLQRNWLSRVQVCFAVVGMITILLLRPQLAGGAVTAVFEYLTGVSVLHGDCRMRNSDLVAKSGGVILLGQIVSSNELHVWGAGHDGGVLDVVCSPNRPECVQRVVYAVIDPSGSVQYTPSGRQAARTMVQYELTRRWLRAL